MDNFVDVDYSGVISDLIHDIHYIDISNRGKMAKLRQHGEILVRKILNIGNDYKLTLGQIRHNSGNGIVNQRLSMLDPNVKDYLIVQVQNITPLGNDSTHTQFIGEITNQNILDAEDAILNLFSIIFINFFLKIKIDINSHAQILFIFSLLPPILRYKTWSFLFEILPKNIEVANKLCLSIIKTFSKEKALEWLNENRLKLLEIPYPNKEKIKKYIFNHSKPMSKYMRQAIVPLDFISYTNMYDLLKGKILDSSTSINESGIMYDSFEKAIHYYQEYAKRPRNEKFVDVTEMFSLGNFVFLGRQVEI